MPAPTNSDAETTPSRAVVGSDACSPLRVCDCGSAPESLYGWLNADYVECPACGARTDEFEMHTGEAEAAWNSRDLLPIHEEHTTIEARLKAVASDECSAPRISD